MSQWPKWLRRQYGKLEICGSSPGYDTNFSLKNYHLLVEDLSFTTPLTSEVIRVAFCSECEKSDKFCSEALISA